MNNFNDVYARRRRHGCAGDETLRQGLQRMAIPATRPEPFQTQAVTLGRCCLGSIGNVTEALAAIGGEAFK